MGETVTLEVPDELARRARALAAATHRRFEDAVLDWLRRAVAIIRRVREAARHRCGYCLSPQRLVMARLEVEHVIPKARGGTDDDSNLWLSCPLCNRHEGIGVASFFGKESAKESVSLLFLRRNRYRFFF